MTFSTPQKLPRLLLGTLLGVLLAPNVQAHCGTASCPFNSSWDKNELNQEAAWMFDLRSEHIDQDKMLHGRSTEHLLNGDSTRITHESVTLSMDYSFASAWGVSLTLPWVSRTRTEIWHDTDALTPEQAWGLDNTQKGMGDMRVSGRYLWALGGTQAVAAQLGVKLATGAHDGTEQWLTYNSDGSVAVAAPSIANRSIQAGTGTTDALYSVLWRYHSNANPLSGFVQLAGQHALNMRDEFRPGDKTSLTGGLRWQFNPFVGGLLQLTAQHNAKDRGTNSEGDETGSNALIFSPGLSTALSDDVQIYTALSIPLYTKVNKEQLAMSRAMAVGITWRH